MAPWRESLCRDHCQNGECGLFPLKFKRSRLQFQARKTWRNILDTLETGTHSGPIRRQDNQSLKETDADGAKKRFWGGRVRQHPLRSSSCR